MAQHEYFITLEFLRQEVSFVAPTIEVLHYAKQPIIQTDMMVFLVLRLNSPVNNFSVMSGWRDMMAANQSGCKQNS